MKENVENFEILFQFEEYCDCHKYDIHKVTECLCNIKRIREQTYWDNMCNIIKNHRIKNKLDLENPSISKP
jgi:hypothetical protein